MFSISRFYRRAAGAAAALCCLLALCGCAPAASDMPTFTETAPSLPSLPASEPEAATPPTSPAPSTPPETLPEEPLAAEAGFISPSAAITSFRQPDSPGLFFAVNEETVPGEISGQEITHSMASLDGSVLALLTQRDELWVLHSQQLLKLSDSASYAELSLSGDCLIWIDSWGNLTLYDVATGQTESIAVSTASASVAPQGKAVAYSVSNLDGSISAWVRIAGEARPFGEDLMPFALADNAELVYALDTREGLLHILDETGAAVGAASPLLPGEQVVFSADHRQILLPRQEGWYLRDGAGREFPIDGPALKQMVTPRGASVLCRRSLSITSLSLPTENLLGHFYLDSENGLWYLDTEAYAFSVSPAVDPESVWVSWDGATLFFRWVDGTLFRTHRSCPGSPTILSSQVEAFAPVWDCSGIYCLDREGRLQYLEDFHDPKPVAENVTAFDVTWDGYCLYLTAPEGEDSPLWVSLQGSPGTPAETGVARLSVTPGAVYLYMRKEDHLDLYCATDAFTFLLVAENVL